MLPAMGKLSDQLNFKRWRRVCRNTHLRSTGCCFTVNISVINVLLHNFYSAPEPKDPPKNVVVSVVPELVNQVKVTFTPPEEPNGNITSYFVYIYEKDQLFKNISLNITHRDQNTMTAVIEGLKGGHSYSIQVKNTYITHTHTQPCLTLFKSTFSLSITPLYACPYFCYLPSFLLFVCL